MDTNENRSEISYKPEFNLLTDAYVNGKYFPAKNGNYFPALSGK